MLVLLLVISLLSTALGSVPPQITVHPSSLIVGVHEPVTLTCEASGNPKPLMVWYKDENEVVTAVSEPNSNRILLPKGSLFFLRVTSDDTGTYWCVATNGFGSAKSNEAQLQTAYLQKRFLEEPAHTRVMLGQETRFNCVPPKGVPQPVVSWIKDDFELEPNFDERLTQYPNGTLVISDVSEADAGVYWCAASNMAATRRSVSAHLLIQPTSKQHENIKSPEGYNLKVVCDDRCSSESTTTAPTPSYESSFLPSVQLERVQTINAAAVKLFWKTEKADDFVISGYKIKWNKSNDPNYFWSVKLNNRKANSHVVGHLQPETVYDFVVIPYYEGPRSNKISGSTGSRPATIESGIDVQILNLTTLRVSWPSPSASVLSPGELAGYHVTLNASNPSDSRSVVTNERAASVTLFRMTPETQYNVTVVALTGNGTKVTVDSQMVFWDKNLENLGPMVLIEYDSGQNSAETDDDDILF